MRPGSISDETADRGADRTGLEPKETRPSESIDTPHQAKVRIVVYGAVHGVGYGDWLKRRALANGISGWARNRSDGTVEAVLAGSPDKVSVLLLRCHDGPTWATVESILIESYSKGVLPGFRIRSRKRFPANPIEAALHRLKNIARTIRRRRKAYLSHRSEFQAYSRWLAQNPASDFKHFYVENIKRYLQGRERQHSTLGPQPRKPGERLLGDLIELGLKPGDVVVDYGCGTLRQGVYFIRYLDAGNYIGLDIDRRILETGRRLAGETLLADKTPCLSLIDSRSLSRAAAANPSWVVSSEVLTHVPPSDLDEYLDNLAQLITEGGRAIVNAPLAKRTIQYSPMGWYHGRARLTRGLAQRGLVAVPMTARRLNSRATKVRMVVSRETFAARHAPDGSPAK